MADTLRLPTQSSLARRQRTLNPIIEEDSDDGQIHSPAMGHQARRADTSHLKIEAWLSPMSDHFPTPRGINYLSAPVLPSSPSTSSADDSSPAASSNPWNRTSLGTENTEFEDLYDVTDEEDNNHKGLRRRSSVRKSGAHVSSGALAKQPTRLVIPDTAEEQRTALEEFKKITSPVPLTPSAQLPMSPAQVQFMDKQQAQDVPTCSAPPSLDGSLSSEQLAAMSAPPTPVMVHDEEKQPKDAWSGVQLQPGALETLHALSNGDDNGNLNEQPEQVLEISQTAPIRPTEMRQQPLRIVTHFEPPSTDGMAFSPNPNRQSLADLTKLDIPSPGGFFAGLSPRTRTTWHTITKSPEAMAPPTSATAEQFYRCPWNMDASVPPVPKLDDSAEQFYRDLIPSSAPVEQVLEVSAGDISDDMPTARPVFEHKNSGSSGETAKTPSSPEAEDAPAEIVVDYDPNYARKQQKEALSNLDRTELWLLAQRAYLKAFDDDKGEGTLETIVEAPEADSHKKPQAEPKELPQAEIKQSTPPKKKSVRFSEMNSAISQPKRLPSNLVRQESAYYRAFQDYVVRNHRGDVFVHQLARFESLQAQRVSLRQAHRNQLLGKYQLSVVPQSAKKRLSTNVVRGDDTITDDLDKLRQEKEVEAAGQMAMPTWHVAAMRFLNGGCLITAPVTKRLARLSQLKPAGGGFTRDRARILDLGGQSTCDWAWHCALQYPNTKVYTVTTKAIRQLSNANIRGPPNHRQVAVDRLTRLPFADSHFDLVYARELHSILKFIGENGEDEWESCLRECMRVLKPGGYIEFSLLDSELMNAGPLGLAKSVEFAFSLKTLGYDPSPSKLWLGRLARAGFQDVRRTWMCLPVGAKRNMHRLPTPPSTGDTAAKESVPLMGSSDNIASACSIVGGWNWERWLLRCEMEKVAGELRLADTVTAGAAMEEAGQCLEGVAAVMEEGRNCKSAFRMLNGYARKPLVSRQTIKVALAE